MLRSSRNSGASGAQHLRRPCVSPSPAKTTQAQPPQKQKRPRRAWPLMHGTTEFPEAEDGRQDQAATEAACSTPFFLVLDLSARPTLSAAMPAMSAFMGSSRRRDTPSKQAPCSMASDLW